MYKQITIQDIKQRCLPVFPLKLTVYEDNIK